MIDTEQPAFIPSLPAAPSLFPPPLPLLSPSWSPTPAVDAGLLIDSCPSSPPTLAHACSY